MTTKNVRPTKHQLCRQSPVVLWGVRLYSNKVRANWSLRLLCTCFRIPSLNILTPLSARPFEDGWYGATRICEFHLLYKRPETQLQQNNWRPLSETIDSGAPNRAKMMRRAWIVVVAVHTPARTTLKIYCVRQSPPSTFYPTLAQKNQCGFLFKDGLASSKAAKELWRIS